jgi:three-Cys-motif partner protein
LAYKVLRGGWDIAYVDGFSGPWKPETADFSDTSFMIALEVLKEAQRIIYEQTRVRRKVRCFFSEKSAAAYQQMVATVAPFHRPDEGFEVKTFHGEFVDAVGEIRTFIGKAFPLIFIDPTGWTEYPLTIIAPLFDYPKCEVLINYMYGHISRFLDHPDEKIIASFDHIFGGPGWQSRLDPTMKKGPAAEKLFRETLKATGKFRYVVSTRIDKSTQDRPHFYLAYGTKDPAGLKAFRETEYRALREHARNRSAAITRMRDERANAGSLFADFEAEQKEASIDDLVHEQKALAKEMLLEMLAVAPAGIVFWDPRRHASGLHVARDQRERRVRGIGQDGQNREHLGHRRAQAHRPNHDQARVRLTPLAGGAERPCPLLVASYCTATNGKGAKSRIMTHSPSHPAASASCAKQA